MLKWINSYLIENSEIIQGVSEVKDQNGATPLGQFCIFIMIQTLFF